MPPADEIFLGFSQGIVASLTQVVAASRLAKNGNTGLMETRTRCGGQGDQAKQAAKVLRFVAALFGWARGLRVGDDKAFDALVGVRLGRISKMGNRNLRKLLFVGARAVSLQAARGTCGA